MTFSQTITQTKRWILLLWGTWMVSMVVLPTIGSAETIAAILREAYRMKLSMPAEGPVQWYVAEGDFVKKGQSLFGVETETLRMKVKLAELQWRQAQAEYTKVRQPYSQEEKEYAEMTFQQQKRLFDSGGISPEALKLADLEYALAIKNPHPQEKIIAHNKVRTKKIEWDMAQQELTQATFLSPAAGVIHQALLRQGEWGRKGDEVLELLGLHPLKLTLNLPLAQAGTLQTGKVLQVTVHSGAGPQVKEARIKYIAHEVEAASQTLSVHVEIENPDYTLKPGMQADVLLP